MQKKFPQVSSRIALDLQKSTITISGMKSDSDNARQYLTALMKTIRDKEYPKFWEDKVRMAVDDQYAVQKYQVTTQDSEYTII